MPNYTTIEEQQGSGESATSVTIHTATGPVEGMMLGGYDLGDLGNADTLAMIADGFEGLGAGYTDAFRAQAAAAGRSSTGAAMMRSLTQNARLSVSPLGPHAGVPGGEAARYGIVRQSMPGGSRGPSEVANILIAKNQRALQAAARKAAVDTRRGFAISKAYQARAKMAAQAGKRAKTDAGRTAAYNATVSWARGAAEAHGKAQRAALVGGGILQAARYRAQAAMAHKGGNTAATKKYLGRAAVTLDAAKKFSRTPVAVVVPPLLSRGPAGAGSWRGPKRLGRPGRGPAPSSAKTSPRLVAAVTREYEVSARSPDPDTLFTPLTRAVSIQDWIAENSGEPAYPGARMNYPSVAAASSDMLVPLGKGYGAPAPRASDLVPSGLRAENRGGRGGFPDILRGRPIRTANITRVAPPPLIYDASEAYLTTVEAATLARGLGGLGDGFTDTLNAMKGLFASSGKALGTAAGQAIGDAAGDADLGKSIGSAVGGAAQSMAGGDAPKVTDPNAKKSEKKVEEGFFEKFKWPIIGAGALVGLGALGYAVSRR